MEQRQETAGEMLERVGTNAQLWAQEFMRTIRRNLIEIDEGFMAGWFANAIEQGRAAGRKEASPFNGLDPAQLERLAILAEEGAEVIQAAMKIVRHGYESYHPETLENNRAALAKELGDFRTSRKLLIRAGDVSGPAIDVASERKFARLARYTHHQQAELLQPERDAERLNQLQASEH